MMTKLLRFLLKWVLYFVVLVVFFAITTPLFGELNVAVKVAELAPGQSYGDIKNQDGGILYTWPMACYTYQDIEIDLKNDALTFYVNCNGLKYLIHAEDNILTISHYIRIFPWVDVDWEFWGKIFDFFSSIGRYF